MQDCFSLSVFCVALTHQAHGVHILLQILYVSPTLHHLDDCWAPFRGITPCVPGASTNLRDHCENVKPSKLKPGPRYFPLREKADSRTLTHLMWLKILRRLDAQSHPPALSLLGFVHFNPADTWLPVDGVCFQQLELLPIQIVIN